MRKKRGQDIQYFATRGARASRIDRAAPRPYLPSINGGPASRRHFGMDVEWGRVYFNP